MWKEIVFLGLEIVGFSKVDFIYMYIFWGKFVYLIAKHHRIL